MPGGRAAAHPSACPLALRTVQTDALARFPGSSCEAAPLKGRRRWGKHGSTLRCSLRSCQSLEVAAWILGFCSQPCSSCPMSSGEITAPLGLRLGHCPHNPAHAHSSVHHRPAASAAVCLSCLDDRSACRGVRGCLPGGCWWPTDRDLRNCVYVAPLGVHARVYMAPLGAHARVYVAPLGAHTHRRGVLRAAHGVPLADGAACYSWGFAEGQAWWLGW